MNVNINHQQAGRKDKELSYRRHEHGIDEHSQRQQIQIDCQPLRMGMRENIEQYVTKTKITLWCVDY